MCTAAAHSCLYTVTSLYNTDDDCRQIKLVVHALDDDRRRADRVGRLPGERLHADRRSALRHVRRRRRFRPGARLRAGNHRRRVLLRKAPRICHR